jgi:hypothetical protein
VKAPGHRELPVPAAMDEGSTEIVRIFRQPDGKHVFVVRGPQKGDSVDPAGWGIIAVDLLQHAANSLERIGLATEDGPLSREDILDRMKVFFDAEWGDPTDEVRRLGDD